MKIFFKRNNVRSQQLRQVSNRLKYDFTENYDGGLEHLLGDFKLFKKGRSKRIRNLMYQTDDFRDIEKRIFDYTYVTGDSKSKKYHNQTVFFVKSKEMNLPELILRPENFLDKLRNLLGFKDINFETHPDFSANYYLKGDDEDWIRAIFNQNILTFFTKHGNWTVEAINYFVIVYQYNNLVPPFQLEKKYMPKAEGIVNMMQKASKKLDV